MAKYLDSVGWCLWKLEGCVYVVLHKREERKGEGTGNEGKGEERNCCLVKVLEFCWCL